jgi:hypothetical protein
VADGRATLHEQCLLAFHEAGLLDLVVRLCNHIELYDKCVVVLMEMVVLALREQDPRVLLQADAAAGSAARVRGCRV